MTELPDGGQRTGDGWRAKWLSPEGYLGLHLVIGFLVAVSAGLLFDLVADIVFGSPTTLAADARAQAIVRSISSPFLDRLAFALAFLGSSPTLTVLSIVIGVALLKVKARRRFAAFAATMAGGGLLNIVLKNFFQRPRPDDSLWLATVSGFSFPSGHSMGAMLFFGSLAYVIYFTFERSRVERIAAIVVCVLATLAIGASRIYLNVHYLSDVIAGFLGGLFWIGVCISATEGWVRVRNRIRSGSGPRIPDSGSEERQV
jgi:membrane-associated phospholipid phosphatase